VQNKGQNNANIQKISNFFKHLTAGTAFALYPQNSSPVKQQTMGIISWILLGLVAGAIAKAIRPGRDPQGCIVTMIIGIVGAVLGGWIATMLGWGDVDGFNLYSILVATGGAVLALFIWAAITGRRRDDL
jgi:uncharacterized membrane protein YeaQ/YmgE (transglycosylase-associated protein family)